MGFIYRGDILDLKKSGVYMILNLTNNKKYIGSTNCFRVRSKAHFSSLKNNRHENKYLQNAFNKYSQQDFEFVILEISNKYVQLEQKYLDEIFSSENYVKHYYNICKDATAPPKLCGEKHPVFGKPSKVIGEKHWLYKKGYLRIGDNNPMYGKTISEENKLKTSQTHKGKNNYNYISPILAKNILTGEEVIGFSMAEVAKLIGVSVMTVECRLLKNSKRYTQSSIKKTWLISRLEEE